jgi:hypothetical protein
MPDRGLELPAAIGGPGQTPPRRRSRAVSASGIRERFEVALRSLVPVIGLEEQRCQQPRPLCHPSPAARRQPLELAHGGGGVTTARQCARALQARFRILPQRLVGDDGFGIATKPEERRRALRKGPLPLFPR